MQKWRKKATSPWAALLAAAFILFSISCSREDDKAEPSEPKEYGCIDCHAQRLDAAHDLGCRACHDGQEPARGKEAAHAGLVRSPAHPDRMRQTCGRCHKDLVEKAALSLHFTLAKEVNAVRAAFGARKKLASLVDIPSPESIETPLDLVDDLLRRRCLRCHVYSAGDSYPETVHGTGCAACHLDYRDGELHSHRFQRQPTDEQCLHCHYGNHVGADYYGRYEHDYSNEFRTPYRTDDAFPRPYGVEYHQLAPDAHQKAGMACIDCHSGRELMASGQGPASGKPFARVRCETCHAWQPGSPLPLKTLEAEQGRLFLVTRHEKKRLAVPLLRNPAHQAYGGQVDCVVCHAQWTFNDKGTHLLRYDGEDYDPWGLLTVQGSFEVEQLLETSLYGDSEKFEVPFMRDAITGVPSLGTWLKGFELRRWEAPLIGRGLDGRLTLFRPILDLHLSYVDADDEVLFDALRSSAPNHGARPYTPHTIGKAGAFFWHRLIANLPEPAKP